MDGRETDHFMILHTITPWSSVKEQSLYVLFRHQSGEGSSCLGAFEHSTHHQHLEREPPKRVPTELARSGGHGEHSCSSRLAEATLRDKILKIKSGHLSLDQTR